MGGKNRPAVGCWRHITQTIGKKTQWALRCNTRIQLAHSTCIRIARIDKSFFTFGPSRDASPLAFVQSIKIIAAHKDFTPNLQHCGNGKTQPWLQPKGDLPNGTDVGGHVFTAFTIASGCRIHQSPLFIAQTHGQAIELQLRNIRNRRSQCIPAQFTANTGVKSLCTARFGIGFCPNAEHRYAVKDRSKSIQHPSTYALRGGIVRLQFRMLRFKILQLPEQFVVFCIWNFRGIQGVVTVSMVMQESTQIVNFFHNRPC